MLIGFHGIWESLTDEGADPNISINNPSDPQIKKVATTARYKQDVLVDAVLRFLAVSQILDSVFPSDKAARLYGRMT